MSSSETPNNSVLDSVLQVLNNNYVLAVIVILVISYGQRTAPRIPKWLTDLFSYDIVRVLFLSLLLIVRFESRPTVALIIAVTFIYIFQYVHLEESMEKFDELTRKRKKQNEQHEQNEQNISVY
jgi:hypothetical protein